MAIHDDRLGSLNDLILNRLGDTFDLGVKVLEDTGSILGQSAELILDLIDRCLQGL